MRTALVVCVLALLCVSGLAEGQTSVYSDNEAEVAPQAQAEAPAAVPEAQPVAAAEEEESEDEEEESDEEETEEPALVEEAGKPRAAGKKARKGKRSPIGRLPPMPAGKPFKFHPERVEAQTTKIADPELGKLNAALEAVKEDILSTHKQIGDERKWVIAVNKIITSYNEKMKRVEQHIVVLRKEMKNLYKKKETNRELETSTGTPGEVERSERRVGDADRLVEARAR